MSFFDASMLGVFCFAAAVVAWIVGGGVLECLRVEWDTWREMRRIRKRKWDGGEEG